MSAGLYANYVSVKSELVDSELAGGEPFELMTKLDGSGEMCTVCGAEAGGVYFGAIVCLPCKSFYIRCTKDTEEPDLKCQQKASLCTPPDGRIKCQSCRFLKCRQAGMMRRKEKPEVVTAPEGKTNCVVCGDIANGIHFGVMTCEGCKKFFRRSQNEAHSYVCREMKACSINPRTRNNCRACRYKKCIDVGMSRDGWRQSSAPYPDILHTSSSAMSPSFVGRQSNPAVYPTAHTFTYKGTMDTSDITSAATSQPDDNFTGVSQSDGTFTGVLQSDGTFTSSPFDNTPTGTSQPVLSPNEFSISNDPSVHSPPTRSAEANWSSVDSAERDMIRQILTEADNQSNQSTALTIGNDETLNRHGDHRPALTSVSGRATFSPQVARRLHKTLPTRPRFKSVQKRNLTPIFRPAMGLGKTRLPYRGRSTTQMKGRHPQMSYSAPIGGLKSSDARRDESTSLSHTKLRAPSSLPSMVHGTQQFPVHTQQALAYADRSSDQQPTNPNQPGPSSRPQESGKDSMLWRSCLETPVSMETTTPSIQHPKTTNVSNVALSGTSELSPALQCCSSHKGGCCSRSVTDDDEMWLMSLLPTFRRLTNYQKAIKVGRPPNKKEALHKRKPYATPSRADDTQKPLNRTRAPMYESNAPIMVKHEDSNNSYSDDTWSLPSTTTNTTLDANAEWDMVLSILEQGGNSLLPINPEDIDILISDNCFNLESNPQPWDNNNDAVVPGEFSPDSDFGLTFPESPYSSGDSSIGCKSLGASGAMSDVSGNFPASPFSVGSSGYVTERSPINMPIADDAEIPMDLNTLETPDVLVGPDGLSTNREAFFGNLDQMPLEFNEQAAIVDDVWRPPVEEMKLVQSGKPGPSAPAAKVTQPVATSNKSRVRGRMSPGVSAPKGKPVVQKKPSPPPTAPPPKKPSPSPAQPAVTSRPSNVSNSGFTAKSNHVSVIKRAKPRSFKKNDVITLRGSKNKSNANQVEAGEGNGAATWGDMDAVLAKSINVDYWAKWKATGPAQAMTRRAELTLCTMRQAWMRAVGLFEADKEALKVKSWAKHASLNEDPQVQNWIRISEGVMNGTAAQVLLLASVPGANALHKGLKRLLVCRSVFSCAVVMNVANFYSPSDMTFKYFWNWKVDQKNTLYEFQTRLLSYAHMLHRLNLDQTEAMLLCCLLTMATDYHDVEAANVEILRTKLLAVLYAYVNGKDSKLGKERAEEIVHFVPYLRHLAFWHDCMMEQLHSVTRVSTKMQRLSI